MNNNLNLINMKKMKPNENFFAALIIGSSIILTILTIIFNIK